jgi:7,8-dihydropterin-6-yl-methyl-4-(beta-D-ribofuranosyl)aminobenzene 5'-phosphate synthase
MTINLNAVDKLEILTLQDNYIDIAAMDGTDMVHRAMPIRELLTRSSMLGRSAV